eukprot:TRINITY_DN4981_c0_g1_i1.p1 TRINITY_DN4981_c0_g1~~TRINITY_DN4981_c0_g1_i1.p1  ORF type:complete len:328 (+),score=35.00 TRINITY_DN4981_c0_g1_i1:155-1138(+)
MFSDLSIFPISRIENWQEDDSNGLSDTDLAIYSIMVILYSVTLIFKLIDEFLTSFQSISPVRWIGFGLFSCLFVRDVYFITLLANNHSLYEDDSLSEFCLIEVPTALYLLALTQAALLWYSVLKVKTKKFPLRKLFVRNLIAFVSIALFLGLTILIWILLEPSGSYSCGGRIYSAPDNSSRQDLRLIFRIIITCFAFGIGTSLAYFGLTVFVTAQSHDVDRTSALFQKKIYLVSLIATTSLMGQCIFFSIYSLTLDMSPEWSFMLIPLELIPIICMMIVLTTSRMVRDTFLSTATSRQTRMISPKPVDSEISRTEGIDTFNNKDSID